MPEKFFYKAKDTKGKTLTGFLEADDEYEAEISLYQQGLNVLTLRTANFFDELNLKFEKLKENLIPITLTDLIIFTRQFATLYSAGIPVITALERLKEQTINLKFKKVLNEITEDVRAGASLYLAFNKHKSVFPSLYVGMIKVGEDGGVLDIILSRLASILETQLETKKRIKSATRYPKLVIISIICAFVVLLTFVIPKFVSLFSKFNTELPLPTKILLWTNNIFQNFWWLFLLIFIVAIIGYKKLNKTEKGKIIIDKFVLKIPIIGDLLSKIYIARIVRILGLLYKSGIPIITGLDIVSEVTGNEIFKNELSKIKKSVATGTSISYAFRTSEVFPPIVADMIGSGEETGLLDEMLFKIADYFDEETDYTIQNLSSAIEPILLVFIATMILTIALGVFLPMWNLMNVFRP